MKIDELATVDLEVKLWICVLKDAQGNVTADYTDSELTYVTLLGFDANGATRSFDGSYPELLQWAHSHGMKAVVREVTETVSI